MKKITLSLLLIPFTAILASAQTPQFAIVKPDGTTFICPSWDSAYIKSLDGDVIYLPGITIAGYAQVNIQKQLTIIELLFLLSALT